MNNSTKSRKFFNLKVLITTVICIIDNYDVLMYFGMDVNY